MRLPIIGASFTGVTGPNHRIVANDWMPFAPPEALASQTDMRMRRCAFVGSSVVFSNVTERSSAWYSATVAVPVKMSPVFCPLPLTVTPPGTRPAL